MPKAGKRTATDATVEQAVKERDEKEQKIQVLLDKSYSVCSSLSLFVFLNAYELLLQILDKYLHSLKDDLKKKDDELTKEKTERKSVEKILGDSLAKIKEVRFSPASLVCLVTHVLWHF